MAIDFNIEGENKTRGAWGSSSLTFRWSQKLKAVKAIELETKDSNVKNGPKFRIETDTLLGRSDDADIVIISKSISRRHVQFFRHAGDQMMLRDLFSSQGTYWNGRQISHLLLTENGTLLLGDVEFSLRIIYKEEKEEDVQPIDSMALPFRTSHAFIIGINDYQHLTPLKTPINDAQALAEKLEADHGYQVHPPLLNATKQELHKFLTQQIPMEVQQEDRILFYFAGHGIALDSDENPKGYLVPADANPGDVDSLIPMDILREMANNLSCRHGLLILDCCFPEAFKWSTDYRDVYFDLPKTIYEERFWQYVKDPAWKVITSTSSEQKVVDIISNQVLGMREEDGKHHSPFAQGLLAGLDGAADVIPANGGDGVITASELYSYLRDHVEDATVKDGNRQTPSMFSLDRHEKGQYIFLTPNHRINLPPRPDRNPFMGLASYQEEDSNYFYGRHKVIEEVLQKLGGSKWFILIGDAGSGKSSLIQAGILPRLRQSGYEILPIIKPGKDPIESLQTLVPMLEEQGKDENPMVLVIDQVEELITLTSSPKPGFFDRFLNRETSQPNPIKEFEEQVLDWQKTYPNLTFIFILRHEFETEITQGLTNSIWSKGRYHLPPIKLHELRELIIKSAAQGVFFYEPETLVDQLLEDSFKNPGVLGLVSFTLSELYYAYLKSGRTDRALLLEDYHSVGGVQGSLMNRLEESYQIFTKKNQQAMRKILEAMVILETGQIKGTRRIYKGSPAWSNEAAHLVVQQLERVQLVRILSETHSNQKYIEFPHESILDWPRLKEWLTQK